MPRTRALLPLWSLLLWRLAAAGLMSVGVTPAGRASQQFDFTTDEQGWQPAHDVARLQATPDGLLIEVSGDDFYLHGPPRDYSADQPLWLRFPGEIRDIVEETGRIRFTVDAWPDHFYQILVVGFETTPRVRVKAARFRSASRTRSTHAPAGSF